MESRKRERMAEAFLEAIIASPEDDAPRLVYADWLDEHGDAARAEFIRAQCRKALLKPWHRDYPILAWRERVLLARHEAAWREELPQIMGITWGTFERGFVHEVQVYNPELLSERAETICRAAPIRWATVSGFGEDWEPCPPAPYLTGLWINGYGNLCKQPESFFCSPLLSALTMLILSGQPMEGEHFAALMASPYLENLHTLLLDDCRLDEVNLRPLIEAEGLRNLTTLSMQGLASGDHQDAPIRCDDIALLAACPYLAQLTSLDLSRGEIDSEALGWLLTSPHLTRLRELDLGDNRLTQEGMASLAAVATPMRLHRLVLARNPIGDAGAAMLAAAPFCAELVDLDLASCEIQPDGVQVLARAPWMSRLGRLNLSHNRAGAGGILALARTLTRELFDLHLCDVGLDSEAVKLLAETESVSGLHTLDLSGNPLDVPAMEALASSPYLGQLRELNLAGCGLDGPALQALAKAPWRQGLVRLTLSGNPLGSTSLAALFGQGSMAGLNDLFLHACALDSSAGSILAAARLTGLHWLNLGQNHLGPAGTKALADSSLAASLVRLILDGNQIGDEGAAALAEGKWGLLANLSLEGNKVSEAGARTLASSSNLARVGLFSCRGNAIRWDTFSKLGSRFRGW
jgi:uncharacterized protein (TIGR02996 family)